MDHALKIRSLRKEFKDFTLKDISFCLPRGYIMGLVGPNGAGKTTTIKLILNLIKKNGGDVLLFGKDHIQNEAWVRSRIGFVHDEPAFFGYLPLLRIKDIVSRFYKDWDDALFFRLASEFGLPLKKKVRTLSRGTTTKFALALALSHKADLLLLDEPTTGLDPVFRRELLERLSAFIQDERKAVLFSTHITTDLERTADYITYLQEGELLFSFTKDEIRDNWALVRGGNELLASDAPGLFLGVRKSEVGFKALTSDREGVRRRFGDAVLIERAPLDDIIYFLNQRKTNG